MSQLLRSARRGISLLEVLVVLFILLVLAGLMIPATRRVREAANRTRCANNLKQMGLAVHNYASASSEKMPGLVSQMPDRDVSIYFALLPYVEANTMYKRGLNHAGAPHDAATDEPGAPPLKSVRIVMYVCPSDASI